MENTMFLSDSHCHIERYLIDNRLSEVLSQASATGVDIIVTMGMTLESSEEAITISLNNEMVRVAVGIHPWNAVRPTVELEKSLSELCKQENVVAIGEVGLDYARYPDTVEVQKELLKFQLSIAREAGLPVSIHCREAYEDMMSILRVEVARGLRGWIHGFHGNQNELHEWLDLGFSVSPGFRALVFNETSSLQKAVRAIPVDRLLTETDCAATEDIAGPGDVIIVAQKIAELRGMDLVTVANTATTNLKRLIGIT